jgi:hypothetical protein
MRCSGVAGKVAGRSVRRRATRPAATVCGSVDLGRRGAKKLRIDTLVTADGTRLPPRDRSRPDRDVVNASPDEDYSYDGPVASYPIDITGPWRNTYKWHVTVDEFHSYDDLYRAVRAHLRAVA